MARIHSAHRSRASGWTAGALFLSLAACRSVVSPAGTDPAADMDEYLSLRSQAICEMNFKCCSVEERLEPDLASCEQGRPKYPMDAAEAGIVSVDLPKSRACFERVRKASCEEWTAILQGDTPSECSGLWIGKANGESCKNFGECSSQYCHREDPANPGALTSSGICGTRGTLGASCTPDIISCEPGLTCIGPDSTPNCERQPREGDACKLDQDCVSDRCKEGVCTRSCWGQPHLSSLFGEPG